MDSTKVERTGVKALTWGIWIWFAFMVLAAAFIAGDIYRTYPHEDGISAGSSQFGWPQALVIGGLTAVVIAPVLILFALGKKIYSRT